MYAKLDPITGSKWSKWSKWFPAKDIASQISWQASVSKGIDQVSKIQAGVYLQPPTWSIAKLAPSERSSAQYVKSFSGHSYPQSACGGASTNLQSLMSHSSIVSYTVKYAIEAKAENVTGKPYVLGETNSGTSEVFTNSLENANAHP